MQIKNATLRVGRRELIAMVVGVLLYSSISWFSNFSHLANAFGADIRPSVAVPIFFGFVFGPIVGFVTGAFGNILNDIISYGLPPNPEALAAGNIAFAFYLNWQIGNGLTGLIPGLMALYHRRYADLNELVQAALYIIAGTCVGIGFAALADIPLPGWTLQRTIDEQFLPIVQHNLLNALIIVPILLFNYSRLDIRSVRWLESRLLRRLVLTLVVSAAVPTFLLGSFLYQQENADNQSLLFKLVFVIIITLLFTVVSAALMAQSLLRPLLQLIGAASQMETSTLPRSEASRLKNTPFTDEVGQLSSIFGRMAEEVIDREASLKRQVESLKIEIDQSKQLKQVAEITENEFFRELQTKAKTMRQRDKHPALNVDAGAAPDGAAPPEETVPMPSPQIAAERNEAEETHERLPSPPELSDTALDNAPSTSDIRSA